MDKARGPAGPDQDGSREERLRGLADLAALPLDERVSERMRGSLRSRLISDPTAFVPRVVSGSEPSIEMGR